LWFAIGTHRCRSPHLRSRTGSPIATFNELIELGHPHSSVEIAREGFRKTGEMICAFLPLLLSHRPNGSAITVDDEFPPTRLCGPIPGWTLDMFTREGRNAIRQFLGRDCPSSNWVRQNIPPNQRIDFLCHIVFCIEGGLMRNRHQWEQARGLRHMAEFECQGPHCPDASEITSLTRVNIDLLNEVRSDVY
jgi:hypothetical protein